MKATAQVFLSYAREDEEKVEELYQKLSAAGFKPWMAKRDILPGEKWESLIPQAIRRSDFFLACLSANSANKRGWIQKEIRDALDIWREKLNSDIYLIPVRLEDCDAPESLGGFQWVDLFEGDGWTRLLEAIRVGMQRRQEMAKSSQKSGGVQLQPRRLFAGKLRAKPLAVITAVIALVAVIFVYLSMRERSDVFDIPVKNHPPVIVNDKIAASTSIVKTGSKVILTVVKVEDLDNDPITYIWEAHRGRVPQGPRAESTVDYVAPNEPGDDVVKVTVSDGQGGVDEAVIVIRVVRSDTITLALTDIPVPPMDTPVPPTATPRPPTATPLPEIPTAVSPTVASVPPTAIKTPPQTPVPPTATPVPPTATATDTPRPPVPAPVLTAVPQPADPIALTIYMRRSETDFTVLSDDQANAGMIYKEGQTVYGDAAVQIGDTAYHFDKPEVGPGEPEQLPDPWRVEFEFAEALVARTGAQAGFDAKKAQFWVGPLDGDSAIDENNPYSLTMKLYEGDALRKSIQVLFAVADALGVGSGGGPEGKTPPSP